MPGARASGMVLIGCWGSPEFVEKIDAARGPRTRSQFCRDALYEKLLALGIDVDVSEAYPADRTGKGGPRYKMRRQRSELNDRSLSTVKPTIEVPGNDPKVIDALKRTKRKTS